MSIKNKIIFVVDDHPLYRSGFIRHLQDYSNFDIYEFDDLASVEKAINANYPDILFLDIELPDGSGLSAIEIYKKLNPIIKIVMLTTHQEVAYIQRSQQLGAHAYLLKDDHPDIVYRCLEHIQESDVFFLSDRCEALMQSQTSTLSIDGVDISGLTLREKEVLYFLGDDLTSKEIAKRLGLSFRTVQNHRANIKSRLMLSRNSQLLKVAAASRKALGKLFSSPNQ